MKENKIDKWEVIMWIFLFAMANVMAYCGYKVVELFEQIDAIHEKMGVEDEDTN